MKTQATTLYPFVPSGPYFARSLEFFAAFGFDKLWEHEGLAGLRYGGAYFILQDIDVPQWQANQMITFEVTVLDTYWSELEAKDLANSIPGVKLRPPTEFPWAAKSTSSTPAGSAGMCARVAAEAGWPRHSTH